MVSKLTAVTVPQALQQLKLSGEAERISVETLKRSHESKAILIPTREPLDNVAITNLALGFSHGESGRLTVPYMRHSGGWN